MTEIRDIDRWFMDEVLPHQQRYRALATRILRNADAGADVVQDVYARLFSSEAWRVIDHPQGYVLRMVRNLAIQQLRRARIVPMDALADTDALDVADPAPDAFDATIGRETMRRVAAAIAALPIRCREIVELRRFHDLTPREIAARLGLSLSTTEKRLARGLLLLAEARDPPPPQPAPGAAAKTKRAVRR